jgi:hypothetical protein
MSAEDVSAIAIKRKEEKKKNIQEQTTKKVMIE